MYVSGYEFRGEEEVERYRAIVDLVGLSEFADPDSPGATVSVTVAYWRKANQIHSWFVQNVQGGEDECQPHHVSREQLRDLRDLCAKQWYWQDLENTVTQLDRVLSAPDDVDFSY